MLNIKVNNTLHPISLLTNNIYYQKTFFIPHFKPNQALTERRKSPAGNTKDTVYRNIYVPGNYFLCPVKGNKIVLAQLRFGEKRTKKHLEFLWDLSVCHVYGLNINAALIHVPAGAFSGKYSRPRQ